MLAIHSLMSRWFDVEISRAQMGGGGHCSDPVLELAAQDLSPLSHRGQCDQHMSTCVCSTVLAHCRSMTRP